jgi:hypothetical protein
MHFTDKHSLNVTVNVTLLLTPCPVTILVFPIPFFCNGTFMYIKPYHVYLHGDRKTLSINVLKRC